MVRRDFISATTKACALVAVGGTALLGGACQKLPVYKATVAAQQISVPVSAFTDGANAIIVRNTSLLDYDILLTRDPAKPDAYTATEMKCSHRANALVASGGGLHCTLHGSRFTTEGKVLEGPATTPLTRYRTESKGDAILLYLS